MPVAPIMITIEIWRLVLTGVAAIVGIAAIFYGPRVALRVQEEGRLKREESAKMQAHRNWIFRTLVATRHLILDQNQVQALNLIPLDFNGDKKVIDALRAYVAVLTVDEDKSPDAVAAERALYKLIEEIGSATGYDQFSVDTIEKLTRSPRGFFQGMTRRLETEVSVLELLRGKKALRVEVSTLAEPKPTC